MSWVAFTTVGRLIEAGFGMQQTGTPPHHTVWLPAAWRTTGVLERLVAAFDRPVERTQVTGA